MGGSGSIEAKSMKRNRNWEESVCICTVEAVGLRGMAAAGCLMGCERPVVAFFLRALDGGRIRLSQEWLKGKIKADEEKKIEKFAGNRKKT